jgi:hypothetical protein
MSEITKSIGVPTMGGVKGAFSDALIGGASGLIYAISQGIFGSGLIGSILSVVLAGSFLKGPRATAVATVAGFMAVAGGLGGGSTQETASTENVRGTM